LSEDFRADKDAFLNKPTPNLEGKQVPHWNRATVPHCERGCGKNNFSRRTCILVQIFPEGSALFP
jgi:hypothetical protein